LKKVVITGVSGFVGANLALLFSKYSDMFSVTGLYYNYSSQQMNNLNIRTSKLDITNKQVLNTMMSELEPEIIIHCAALGGLENCESHPAEARKVNVIGTENIMTWAQASGAKMVHISTDIIFNGKDEIYVEESTPSPVNVYGRTKADAEELIVNTMDKSSWLVIRLSVQYGTHPFQRTMDFVNYLINHLRKKEEVLLFTDKFRNVTYVNWTVETILKLIEHESNGIFHVCGDECINYYEWGAMIANEFELPSELMIPTKLENTHQNVTRPKKLLLDNSKLKAELGNSAMMPKISETLQTLKNTI
jgi:dTDP-4-dehydrorhamnose reductase